MRAAGLQGAFVRKRWRGSTRQDPRATPAPDLVNRQFTVAEPNRLWVADISRIPTGEGPLWLASVRDAFSRRIVGWKSSDRADTDLVLGALEYAIWGRDLDSGGDPDLDPDRRRLIHHSDKGAQYTAIRFTHRLADAGIAASTGTVGDSYDNALAENFFSALKVERVYRTSFRTREEADLALFRYIDGWFGTRTASRSGLAGAAPTSTKPPIRPRRQPNPHRLPCRLRSTRNPWAPRSPTSEKSGEAQRPPTHRHEPQHSFDLPAEVGGGWAGAGGG
jgi:transposase InsO family protein